MAGFLRRHPIKSGRDNSLKSAGCRRAEQTLQHSTISGGAGALFSDCMYSFSEKKGTKSCAGMWKM